MKFIKNLFKWKTGKINSSLPVPAINNDLQYKPRRIMMALEPRIMFDGAAVTTAADTVTDSGPPAQDTAAIAQDAAKLVQATADVAPPVAELQRNEIVFIETTWPITSNWRMALSPARKCMYWMQDRTAWHRWRKFWLVVAASTPFTSSPSVDGAVLFGATSLSAENLQQYSGELAVIGDALTQNGDILLYGCDVGVGASGAAFVSELASATGADVAASSDPTGAAALGGDWQLETQTGTIDTGTALTDAETADYGHLLFTEDFATDPGLGAHPASFTLNGFTYAFSGGDGGGFAWNSSIGVGGTGAVNPFSNSTNTGTTEIITITYASGAFSFTSMEVKSTTHAWTFTGKLGGSTVSGASFTTGVGTVFQTVSFGSLKTIDTLVITSVNFKANTDALDNFITTVPPINTVPGAQTMLEDTTLTFSSGTSNAITVADSDSDSLTVTLSVTSGSGSLTLAGTRGLSFTNGDGTADETMTFSGTKADINAALDGLKYTPIANGFNPGYSTLTIATGDGSSTDTDTVTINVTAVNDPPTLMATASSPTYTEGGAAVTLFSGAAISTVENFQTITSLTLTLTVSNISTTDVLNIDGSNVTLTDGASVASTAANAMTVTITKDVGIDTDLAQTLVNGISYRNSGDDPTASGTTRVATLTQIKDSGGTSNGGVDTTTLSVASTVTVTPVNDAPTLTATAANPTFTEGGAAATLFSSAAVSAVESADNIEQLVLTVSNVTDGAAEILTIDGSSVALTHGNSVTTASNSMTAGVSLTSTTATVTISKAGGITAAQAQTLVNALAYRNSSDDPTTANRVVTLTAIKDTGGTSNGGVDSTTLSVASTVTVTAVNDAPTVSAPASITVTEDVATMLTGISVSDVDAGSSNVVVTFTVGSGALAGDSAIATTNSVNIGGTSGALTLTGSTANINAFIAAGGLKFTTASNDTTAVTLGVSVNDQGNTGTGGSQSSATTNVTLNVTAVNDAPTITSGATYTFADTNEDTASGGVTVNTLLTGAASWADPDCTDVAKGIAVTGTTGNGTWQYSTDGDTWTDFGTVSGTSALLLDGATQVRYQPDLANGETASFIYKAWDETSGAASTNNIRQTANAGIGGGSTAFSSNSANGSITVTSVNDAPTGVGNLILAAINEDSSNPTGTAISALTGYSFQDVDTGATTPGILVVGNRANAATEGVWQYSSDGGANWKAIGAVTDGTTALALANTAQIRFVPAANFNGTPTALNIRVLDNTYNGTFSTTTGGTETRITADSSANGGATAISGNLNTISTSITAINDAPSFIKGADQTFNADAGAQVVNNWATGLSAGPADESGQALSFVVSNNNNALFSRQPTIDSNGNLSYTPAANANGSATVTVSIKDSGGTANGGVDTSASQTFTITVNSTTINLSQISGNTDGKPNPPIGMVNTVRADNIAEAGINIETDKNKIISDSFTTDYRNRAIDSFSLDNTGFSANQAIVVYMELGVESGGNKTSGGTINMPFSVFAGLDTFGGVTITAELSTGQHLPPWISVDPITGAVTVKEGAVVTSPIIVKVTISDSRGKEVVVLVKVQPQRQQPDDTEKNQPPGQDQQSRARWSDKQLAHVSKPGLTQQLQMVGSKGFEMQRLKLLDSLASLVSNDKDAA